MTSATRIDTRLLLLTTDGVSATTSTATSGGFETRDLLDYPQPGQRIWGGYCLAIDADGKTVYAGSGDGVRRSRDGGLTWEAAAADLAGKDVRGLEAHPYREGLVLAGLTPAAIFRSVDFGQHWTETDLSAVPERDQWRYPVPPNVAQARAFAFDPRDPDRIYAGVEEGGILVSRDGGKTWRDSSAGLTWSAKSRTPKADVHSLAVDPHDPNVLHAALGSGYHISLDSGGQWERRMEGMPLEYTRAIAADRSRPGRLLVGTSEYPPVWMEVSVDAPQIAPAGGRLFETLDDGMHWRQITGGFPERNEHVLSGIVQHPQDGRRWFITAVGGGIYSSDDSGKTWRLALSGLPGIHDVGFAPAG